MRRRAAFVISACLAAVLIALGVEERSALGIGKRDDRAASPMAVLEESQRGVSWDAVVARTWPEIDTPAPLAARTGRKMEQAFEGSDVLASLSSELAKLERSTLRALLTREARLRKHQGALGRARAQTLGKESWWLRIWCDETWQQNQAALLGSAQALLGYYGYTFSPDGSRRERSLAELIHCRRAIRFSITAGDKSAASERKRTDWFVPVTEENAQLLVRVRAVEPETARQRRWHRALLDAAEADARWLRFIARAQQGDATAAERQREVERWVPLDAAFTRATTDAARPDS